MEKENINSSTLKTAPWLQWFVVVCCQLIFIGFVCSRVLASVGMIALFAAVLLSGNLKESARRYFRSRELLILSLFFWIVFISGAWSTDKIDWLNWVRIKLPYLILPFAFANLKKLDDKKFVAVIYGFIITLFISTVIILSNYALHYAEITEGLRHGGAIPIKYSHIRFSLMLAFSFFCCLYLLYKRSYCFTEREKWLQGFFALFALVALHILTVRSGLLSLYLGLFYLAFFAAFKSKKIWVGTALLAFIIAAPSAAYLLVPSFKNKLTYMRFDLAEYQRGNTNGRNDALRLLSLKMGLDVWQTSPWIGVGAGDLKKEMTDLYRSKYPDVTEDNYKMPHNQFIWVMATTGIVGLALFLFAFFYPPQVKGYYKQWLVVVFHIIIFSSFFTEDTLEEQVGTGFYLIFLLLLLNYFSADE